MANPTYQGEDLSGLVRRTHPNTIGSGGATDIYLGELRQAGLPPVRVAIKIFRQGHLVEDSEQEANTRRLIRESKVWHQLDHPNVQPYYGFCRPSEAVGPSLALISPFCVNGTVIQYMARNPGLDRRRLVRQVAEGLKYLHTAKSQPVIHGDLSGRNVLIDDNGNARLADFGRAKILGQAEYDTTLFAGSTEYMAPELFADVEIAPFSTMSDIFAFSMLTFQLFTDLRPLQSRTKLNQMALIRLILAGRRPNRAHDDQKRIPDRMWSLMEECWATDPRRRPTITAIVPRL